MTFTNVITALIILGLFFSGFAQAFLPAYSAWNKAMMEYRSAKTIRFVAESFRRECEKPERNIENWKKQVSVAKELESYQIIELKQEDVLRALKLVAIISNERVEIIGECTP
jgi:hypothetical protein